MGNLVAQRLSLGWHRPVSALRRGLSKLADVAMPPVCLRCNDRLSSHHALCASCWSSIDFIQPPLCDRLGTPLPYGIGDGVISAAAMAQPPSYDRARAVGVYGGTLRQLVHDFKFRDRQELRALFERWLISAGMPFWPTADLIIPVPLHRTRLLKRRFNQSAVLSEAVGARIGVSVAPLCLKRARATRQQVGLTPEQRRKNVRGAFTIAEKQREQVFGQNIILVDDVITTGATVSACADVLRSAGARQVNVVVLALSVPGYGDLGGREGLNF